MIELDFMDRVKEVCKDQIEENILFEKKRKSKWRKNNPEAFKNSLRKYSCSEKGKIAARRSSSIRSRRYRFLIKDLSNKDLENIKDFYCKRPQGYHVDHIHPLSKGGKHHISNLQYLPAKENLQKSDNLPGNWPKLILPESDKPLSSILDTWYICENDGSIIYLPGLKKLAKKLK